MKVKINKNKHLISKNFLIKDIIYINIDQKTYLIKTSLSFPTDLIILLIKHIQISIRVLTHILNKKLKGSVKRKTNS